jgi:hypothetical protein
MVAEKYRVGWDKIQPQQYTDALGNMLMMLAERRKEAEEAEAEEAEAGGSGSGAGGDRSTRESVKELSRSSTREREREVDATVLEKWKRLTAAAVEHHAVMEALRR